MPDQIEKIREEMQNALQKPVGITGVIYIQDLESYTVRLEEHCATLVNQLAATREQKKLLEADATENILLRTRLHTAQQTAREMAQWVVELSPTELEELYSRGREKRDYYKQVQDIQEKAQAYLAHTQEGQSK